MTSSLEVTDQESAAVATHPRVSLEDIKNAIANVYYVNAADAVFGNHNSDEGSEALSLMTVCFILMKNGFVVIGKAAPASPENFDMDLGRKFAYEDAVRQLWPLMGYALKERLYGGKA